MTADTQPPSALVGTDWLAGHLAAPDLCILECTSYLEPAEPHGYRTVSGREQWLASHIPGSGFADLTGDLRDRASPLRYMLPPAAQFAEAMSRLGVGDGVHVVLYDRHENMWATRVWWMLRAFGFDAASVLDGGWRKWTRENRPVSGEVATVEPREFVPRPRPALFTDRAGVLAGLDDAGVCLLNALKPEQHAGIGGVHYGRPGRIPGSVNVSAHHLVDPDTHAYLPADVLEARLAGAGALDAEQVITYCGGGIAASGVAFILTLLGHRQVSLYDASLSQWAADPALPMESD